ncbi:hypothetical protein A2Z67_01475 [Candidatus Woesebacteria bacterium RBG_13_36_22]|uniref:Uncharacterized protein n=1 Tax=Candidatus Woesebacteria bacterium RBG_13_36_22 TaxID=1802478 RepID=A0A1F7WZZ4_9BACT|nr:MAG: hypothetical protein A2Z67_01475 [Candidatus Woesebacteria bacterium RBG_13_36_22]
MNERFEWKIQAAEMCDQLAETFTFIAVVNKELGKFKKSVKSTKKALSLIRKSEGFRKEVETPADYNGKNLQL